MTAPPTTLITGLTNDQLDAYEAKAEAAVRSALHHVLNTVADHIGKTRTAAALVAADPGEPYVSPDDLAAITPLWQQQMDQTLLPLVGEVYQDSAGTLHTSLIDVTGLSELPSVTPLAAQAQLAAATNSFEQVGAQAWETARSELLDGFAAGESIPQLAQRLRDSADMTATRATLVARTQVLAASNAGSYDTAVASGLDLLKGWEATPDLRTRETHLAAWSRYSGPDMIRLAELFMVGGWPCQHPHDPELPPEERYNCRCTTVYQVREPGQIERMRLEQEAQRARIEEQLAEQRRAREAIIEEQRQRLAATLEEQRRQLERSFEEIRRGRTLAKAIPDTGPGEAAASGRVTEIMVRPSLQAADTVAEVRRVFLAEWSALIRPQGLIGPPRARFLAAADVQTVREEAEALLRVIERFPRAPLAVSTGKTAGAYARTDDLVVIVFDNDYARDRAAFLTSLRQGGLRDEQGYVWHPMSTASPGGVATHEFGHVLHHAVSALQPIGPGDLTAFKYSTRIDDLAEKIARDLAAERGVDVDELVRTELGVYAAEGSKAAASRTPELIADAFADAMINGDGASVLSKRIFVMLVDEYDKALPSRVISPPGIVFPKSARITPTQFEARTRTAASGQTALRASRIDQIQDQIVAADVRDFGLEGYRTVNRALEAAGADPLPSSVDFFTRRTITSIDSLMRPIDRQIVVSRGITRQAVEAIFGSVPEPGSIPAGFEWTSFGYSSTSVLRGSRLGEAFTGGEGGMRLRILAPRGTRGFSTSPTLRRGELGALDPDEVLLDRGLTYRLVADHGIVDGIRQLDVEIVPAVTQPQEFVPLGRAIGEALVQLDAGSDLPSIVALFEGDPALRKALLAARRATDRDKLGAALRRLADRESITIPTPAQLRAIKTAERRAAAAAKREAAAAVRAEKAKAAQLKAQVKEVEAGQFQHLDHVAGDVFQGPDGTRWLVVEFRTEKAAREQALAAVLRDLVRADRTVPDLTAVVGRGAGRGWQVAYRGLATDPGFVDLEGWLTAGFDRLTALTPTKVRALVARYGLDPQVGDQLVLKRAGAIFNAKVLNRRFPSRNAPAMRVFVDQNPAKSLFDNADVTGPVARWVNGPYGNAGLRARLISAKIDTNGNLYIEGQIRSGSKVVGTFGRRLDTASGTAHHTILKLQPQYRGTGFAEQFNANLIDWYHRSGFTEVRLGANIDIGGYTWASAGYDFASSADAGRIMTRLETLIDSLQGRGIPPINAGDMSQLAPSEIDAQIHAAQAMLARARQYAFDDDNFPTAYEFSQIGRHAGQSKDDMWIGKAAMLGSYWNGVLSLL